MPLQGQLRSIGANCYSGAVQVNQGQFVQEGTPVELRLIAANQGQSGLLVANQALMHT